MTLGQAARFKEALITFSQGVYVRCKSFDCEMSLKFLDFYGSSLKSTSFSPEKLAKEPNRHRMILNGDFSCLRTSGPQPGRD
jgi:hypothetical protein